MSRRYSRLPSHPIDPRYRRLFIRCSTRARAPDRFMHEISASTNTIYITDLNVTHRHSGVIRTSTRCQVDTRYSWRNLPLKQVLVLGLRPDFAVRNLPRFVSMNHQMVNLSVVASLCDLPPGTARGRSRSAKPKKTEKEVGAVAEVRY